MSLGSDDAWDVDLRLDLVMGVQEQVLQELRRNNELLALVLEQLSSSSSIGTDLNSIPWWVHARWPSARRTFVCSECAGPVSSSAIGSPEVYFQRFSIKYCDDDAVAQDLTMTDLNASPASSHASSAHAVRQRSRLIPSTQRRHLDP